MRVWDCDPSELSRRDLLAEWEALARIWRAVHHRRHGVFTVDATPERVADIDHPETLRFVASPWLIVCRHDALWAEFHGRGLQPDGDLEAVVSGLSANTVALVDVIERGDDWRRVRPSEHGAWEDFAAKFNWPTLGDEPATPWGVSGLPYDQYRKHAA